MTAATAPKTSIIVKLAPNVPEAIEIKYADVVAGQYGDQIRLRGKGKDGADRMIYVPVDLSASLVSAGAIATDTGKGLTYKPVSGWWVVEKRQRAGEKHPTTYLWREGAATAGVASKPPEPAPKPTTETPSRDAVIVELYRDSLKRAIHIGAAMNGMEDPPFVFTAGDIAAMAATLFISRSRASGL